jgi:hypothetical protein
MSKYIGLIVGTNTRTVYSVINPDDQMGEIDGDSYLDEPARLELENVNQEPVHMVKLEREHYGYPGEMSPDNVYELLVRWYVEASEIYQGPDILVGAI